MAQLRRNHDKGIGSNVLRVVFLFLLIMGLIWWFWNSKTAYNIDAKGGKNILIGNSNDKINLDINLLPTSSTGEVIDKGYYTLSYSEEHEQAEWVAYSLTKESLLIKNVERERWYEEDPDIKNGSATYYDYKGSGYSRGHLIPAADLAFSRDAMMASMFMSNMSPQKQLFNGGVWNELENQVRNWAYDRDEVYVVTGPVLTRGHIIEEIGKNHVSVSDAFYKIVYDPNSKVAISFLIPNDISEKRLQTYAVTIDYIEDITGIDFFAGYFSEEEERKIESTYDIEDWDFDEKLYMQRVSEWNKR